MSEGARAYQSVRHITDALAEPTSLKFLAWALPLPLVALDALAAPFILLDDPSQRIVLRSVLAAVGLYAVGLLIYRLAAWLSCGESAPSRAIAAVTAYALTGGAWVTGVLWALGTGTGSRTPLQGPSLPGAASGALMQVLLSSLIAVVLSGRVATAAAALDAQAAQQLLTTSVTDLKVVRAAARRSLLSWVDAVLAPGIARQRAALVSVDHTDSTTIQAVLNSLDDFRESVVRSGSHGLHPRAVRIGLRPSLQAILRQHGHGDIHVDPIDLSLPGESTPNDDVAACLARATDLILDAASLGGGARIEIAHDEATWVLRIIDVRVDTSDLPILELQARLRERGGHMLVTVDDLGAAILEVRITDGAITTINSASTPPVSLATWSCALLVPITAVLLTLLEASLPAIVGGTLAAVSVALYATILLPRRTSALPSTALSCTCVGLATATTITTAWFLVGTAESGRSLLLFTLANAVVISLLVGFIATARGLVQRWHLHAEAAIAATESILSESGATTREIDDLRANVAGLLHSRVQARLVAAAGRLIRKPLQSTDVDRAAQALDAIAEIDVPELRRLITESDERPDLRTVVAEFLGSDDVQIECAAPEYLEPQIAGRVSDIVREAVANAVSHGAATHITIVVTASHTDYKVRVTDDGLGMPEVPSRGLGTAVIDAASSGRWELRNGTAGGAELIATVAP